MSGSDFTDGPPLDLTLVKSRPKGPAGRRLPKKPKPSTSAFRSDHQSPSRSYTKPTDKPSETITVTMQQESAQIIAPIGVGFYHPSPGASGPSGGTIMEGTLSKWTNVMKGWQFRCFLLDENTGLLSYYTSKEKMRRGVRRGCIRLQGAVLGIDDEEDANFTITVDSKIFHLQAKDAEEREIWVRALEDAILKHARHHRPGSYNYIPYHHSTLSHHYLNAPGGSSSHYVMQGSSPLYHFEQRLAQADVYLQMLIQQINGLENRPELNGIVTKANEFLEAIKHSIVLLQIAKNTAFPVQPSAVAPIILHYSDPEVQTGIEFGAECRESVSSTGSVGSPCRTQAYAQNPNITSQSVSSEGSSKSSTSIPPNATQVHSSEVIKPPPNTSQVPLSLQKSPSIIQTSIISSPSDASSPVLFSYSSSDDEQDFYDAEDFDVDKSGPAEPGAMPKPAKNNIHAIANAGDGVVVDGVVPNADTNELDYDALYNDESADEDLDANHGSVISHLLSQVKIGMDLTKVTLPTFILERRSLLEMYADFFAHPDMFISVADAPTPRERFVTVLRWYLGAFHAGRRSEVCKKPYNPILGEVFECYWNLPDDCNPKPVANHTIDENINNRDLKYYPWVEDENAVVYYGEQVSHHPPVSGFYAEHVGKRVSLMAHIWTKSKFLGLSVGVHNIGHAVLSLHNLPQREDYVIGFPNGYARSILSVPWVELGGQVTLSSSQTGYHATVEFKTKPFFSGDKNKIVAKAFSPDDKNKPFLTVEGEWNGGMTAKWADGRSTKFLDVKKLDIIKKNTRPVAQQAPNESRRMWKEVTAGLKLKDMERASAAKFALEEKQRHDAQVRSKANTTWQPKKFIRAGDIWIFTEPLDQRLKMLEKGGKKAAGNVADNNPVNPVVNPSDTTKRATND